MLTLSRNFKISIFGGLFISLAIINYAYTSDLLFRKSCEGSGGENMLKEELETMDWKKMGDIESCEDTNAKRLCVDETSRQILKELNASYVYLTMAAHFSRDIVNRPGAEKLFFEAASEERQHAIQLLNYMNMRGHFPQKCILQKFFKEDGIASKVHYGWSTLKGALKAALAAEIEVTESILTLIQVCEGTATPDSTGRNDYHIVDYLTGVILEEQHKGMRDLVTKISTLLKLLESHAEPGELGEFIFDRKMLQGEI